MPNSLSPLLSQLKAYQARRHTRFHMPGHAGKNLTGFLPDLQSLFDFDLTELDGLDVLSHPEECLAESQAVAAQLYGVVRSFYLVNGSTVGLMAAMLSCLGQGDAVLLPRNSHRAVVNGLVLTGATPIWFLPEWDSKWGLFKGVTVQDIEREVVAHPNVKAVILTSPTYEGWVSEVAAIAAFCRSKQITLIVDEAHGALWPFHEALPQSACQMMGVDGVVHSLHKTAGSLTQTAIAHLPVDSTIDPKRFQQALNVLQTTSPSYVLLASLEATCAFLGSAEGKEHIAQHVQRIQTLRAQLEALLQNHPHIPLQLLPESQTVDLSKLHFRCEGDVWGDYFEAEHHLFCEQANDYGVTFLCGLGLEAHDFAQFYACFKKACETPPIQNTLATECSLQFQLPKMAMTPREAFFTQNLPNNISHTMHVPCPPGIPVTLPGEIQNV